MKNPGNIVISADPAKATVEVNEFFAVTVVTSDTVNKLKILNELDSTMGFTVVDKVTGEGITTWTISLKIGSTGSAREFTVYGAPKGGDYNEEVEAFTTFTVAVVKATPPAPAPAVVISAEPEKPSVKVNEVFEITVITNDTVNKLRVANKDTDATIGSTVVTKEAGQEEGTLEWTITVKIGSTGAKREFYVYAAGKDGIFNEAEDAFGYFFIAVTKA